MPFDYQSIIDTYRQLHEEANAANQERYDAILNEIRMTTEQVGGQYDQVNALLDTIGATELSDLEERGKQEQATAEQDIITRGLGNTTIRESVRRGIESDVQRGRERINQATAVQKAGVKERQATVQSQLGQWLTGVMERRTDKGPDLDVFSRLLEEVGKGSGGITVKYGQPSNRTGSMF